LVYVIKIYAASIGEFADKLNEQKTAQLEEVKQASIKQIQDAIDLEKSQQALVQNLCDKVFLYCSLLKLVSLS
uniref:ATP synthase subunit b n=1 Tax=Phocoena sinus TaxID=42100 RepID=A0A8C9EDJ7_PHOSS